MSPKRNLTVTKQKRGTIPRKGGKCLSATGDTRQRRDNVSISMKAGKSSSASGDKHLLRKRPAARTAGEASPASGGNTGPDTAERTRVYSHGVLIRCHKSKRQEVADACKAKRNARCIWSRKVWHKEMQALKASMDLGVSTHGGNRTGTSKPTRKSNDTETGSEKATESSESTDKVAESESLATGNTGRSPRKSGDSGNVAASESLAPGNAGPETGTGRGKSSDSDKVAASESLAPGNTGPDTVAGMGEV